MAEDLDIKALWKRSKEKSEVPDLRERLTSKGKRSSLAWIRIILTVEFWLSVVMAPFMIYYMISVDYPTWALISYGILTVGYLFYYQFLIKQIRSFRYDQDVIRNLRKVYNYLRFYLLHYKVVIWLSLIVGFISGMYADENRENLEAINSTSQWAIMFAVSGVLILIAGLIFHLIIYLLYGRKVKRIKRILLDLENDQ